MEPAAPHAGDPQPPPSAPGDGGAWSPWTALARFVVRRPGLTVLLSGVLVIAAGLAALLGLGVRPGYVDLLSRDAPSQARYLRLLEDFGNVEALHVVVEADDPATAGRFVDAFGPRLAGLRDDGRPLVASALWSVDLGWFVERLPAYVPASQLRASVAADSAVDLRALATDPSPQVVIDTVTSAIAGALEGGTALPSGEAGRASALLASLLDETAAAARGEPASLATFLARSAGLGASQLVDSAGHVRIDPSRLLVVVTPEDVRNDFEPMSRFLSGVRDLAASVQREVPGARVSFAGAPVLVVDEMRAVRHDATLSSLISLALVTLLYVVSFRPFRHVALAVVAGLCGLVLSFGAAWVLVSDLNLFSIVFAAILIGIGMDFGIHLVNFHGGLRRAGERDPGAIVTCVRAVGPPTAVGALTSAAAFFATLLSDFRGFSQLGLVSGAGVLLCLLTAMTLLPALLALDARRARASAKPPPEPTRPWSHGLLALPVAWPGATLLVGAGLVAAAAAGTSRLRFDYNLLDLQPKGTEAVELAEGSRPVLTHFAYSLADSPEEARKAADELRSLRTVGTVTSAADLLPANPDPAALRALAGRLADLPPTPSTPIVPERVRASLDRLVARLHEAQDAAFDAGRDDDVQALDAVLAAADRLAADLARDTAAAGLTAFRDHAGEDVRRLAARLPELAERGVSPGDLPQALRDRLVGRSGQLALIIEPKAPAWTRPELLAFVADLRRVDPEVTGPPVQILEITDTMRRSLETAAGAAFFVIVVIVLLVLRRPLATLAALAPVVTGFAAMLGVLGWTGVPLNPANLVALPLLLGIGVDSGVHVTHRWLEVRDARQALHDVGHAVLVTALTTLIGFGGLLLGQHRGIRSLGVVASIGTCAMLITSIVILPAALRLAERARAGR